MYSHDLSNTRANPDEKTISSTTAPLLRPAWSFQTKGDVTGTPIVVGNNVFFGSIDHHVYDVADQGDHANLVWSVAVGGEVNGSVAFSKGRLYVPVSIPSQNPPPGAEPSVVALDARTGHLLWRTVIDRQPRSDVFGSPTIWNGMLFIGQSALFCEVNCDPSQLKGLGGSIVALNLGARPDLPDGAIVWKTRTVAPECSGGGVWGTPAIDPARGVLWVGTGNAYVPCDGGPNDGGADPHTDSVLTLDANTGAILSSYQATPNDIWNAQSNFTGQDYDFGASPQFFQAGGKTLVGVGQKSGVYWAFDASDPTNVTPVWSTRPVSMGSFLGGILATPAVAGGDVFGGSGVPGGFWSLSGGDGSIRWWEPEPEPWQLGPPAYANGVVIAASLDGQLVAFDASTGIPLLRFPLSGPTSGGVSIANGTVYVGSGSGLSSSSSGSVTAFKPIAP